MEVGTVAMETKPAVGDGKEGYHPEQQSSADPLAELGFNSFVACGTLGSVDLLATAPQLEEPVSYPELRNVVLDTGQQRLITNCEASKQRMTPEDGLSTPPLQPDTTLELESGMGSGAESDPIRCEDCGNEFRGMAEYYQHRCTLEEDDDEDGGDEEDEDKMTTSGSAGRNVAALSYCTDQRFTLPTTSSSSMVMSMSNAAAAAAAISSSGSTLKAYRPRESSATDRDGAFHDYDSVGSSPSDVETFDGKIVYNPDGSAYIIDVGETEGSDDEISLDLPRHEGSVVDGRGVKSPSSVRPIPPIVNAFHVSRNPTLYSAMYGQAYANLLQEKKKVPEVPIMLSYRVYSVRDKSSYCTDEGKENETNVDPNTRPGFSDLETTKPKFPSFGCSSVPVKPILMCFICKLSFGNSKSFVAHALGEHSMSLNEEEKSLMDRRNTSAIVQGVGKDKVPLLSFLEPVPPSDSRDCNEQFFAQTVNTSCASSLSGCDAATVAAVAASFASSMASTTNATFTGTTSATQTSPTFTTCTSNSSPSGSCFGLQAKKGLHPSTLVIPSSPVTANRRSPERSPLSQHRRASVTSQVNDGDREDLDEEFESGQNLALKEDVDVPLQCSSKLRNARKKCNIRVPDRLNDALSHLSHYGGSSLDIRKSPIASSISPLNNDRQSGDICNPPPSISPLASSASPASSQAFPNLSHSPSAATAAHTPVSSTVALNLTGGSPLGICTDHPNGRLSGVECPKCDMILGSSRSLGGHMTMMHSRNSCKTLKCPKCNWHYKYQETLEIHMKEKHPENETTCIYCITNQPHPRLARGETYTCGYKPYRCDVCNYSTTTKGNLSIHMQSDKHLNNMQELQNGGMSTEGLTQTAGMGSSPTAPSAPTASSPSVTPNQKPKPKPTWRCDVCNYETNVARNLRIHMTSEKHTHNMMVLQQNVKHMQQLSAFQAQAAQALDPALLQFHPGLTLPGDKPPPHTEAALADMAYNQALLIQLMTGGQLGQMPELPLDVGLQALQESLAAVAAAGGSGVSSLGSGMVPATSPGSSVAIPSPGMTPGGHMPLDEPNTDPTKLFQCCVCSVYGCDSVELLSQHLQQDRTKQREHEILMVMAGNYVCKLCSYKTNLKANFQLHCKTDKHLQRLQHINHIKEGGLSNEWKLKYLNVSNPIQVKCNACNYYTNSTHKLQLHVANPRHELDARLFRHLQTCDLGMAADTKYYHCALCSFSTRTKVALIQHVHSIRHMRCESLRQLHQSKNSAKDHDDDFADIFHVRELADGEIVSFDVESAEVKDEELFDNEDQLEEEGEVGEPGLSSSSSSSSMLKQALLESSKLSSETGTATSSEHSHTCPYCNYTSSNEMRIQAHILSQHTQRPQEILCPLCQEGFREKTKLEKHLTQVHNVTAEGLQRLLLMVDSSQWLLLSNPPPSQSPGGANSEGSSDDSKGDNSDSELRFEEGVDLTDRMSDQGDWVDEYRCTMCSKCFKNIDDLYTHQNELGHFELKQTPRGPGYLCWKKGCNQYFKTSQALQVHFREIHAKRQHLSVSERHVYKYRCSQCSLAFKTMEKLQLHSQYHIIRDATKCVLCCRSFRSISALQRHVETSHADLSEMELEQYRASLANNPLLLMGLGAQQLDASVAAEMLKKEVSKGDDCFDLDDDAADFDNNHSDDMAADGLDAEGEDGSEANAGELTLKEQQEQQMLDDYLNSQSMAEDSYNNPFRKYKCHRCKVAFTKQSYLTSHNKTLLHRKGERLSYPMEKYLDPNRPYKCDVCKESFTQKNILLVHYNSVSHLHKLKRSIQEQNCQSGANGNGASASTSSATGGDSDKKPYKCNICKVAYSQGSTLDIHMRSVLHQTRASKLQELVMTGQVDPAQPLIEQPEPQKVQDQQKKILTEMLSTKASPQGQLNVPVSAALSVAHLHNQVSMANQVPIVSASHQTSLTSPTTSHHSCNPSPQQQLHQHSISQQQSSMSSSPIAQPPVLLPSQVSPQAMFTCQRCSSIFVTHEALLQHQQLYCFFQPPIPIIPPSSVVQSTMANFLSPKQQQQSSPHLQIQNQLQTSTSSNGQTSLHGLSPGAHSQQQSPQRSSPVQQSPQSSAVSQLQHHQSLLQSSPTQAQTQQQQQQQQQHQQQQQQQQQQQHLTTFGKFVLPKMKSSSVYKHLMESYGFELVMQFNEYHQKRPRKEDGDRKSDDKLGNDTKLEGKSEDRKHGSDPSCEKAWRDLPEIGKSACPKCGKEFSSIWVLKAHKEEIHNCIVPLSEVEKFSEEFKADYDRRNPPLPVVPPSETPDSTPISEPSSSPAEISSASIQANMMVPPVSLANSQVSEFNAAINAMAASQMSQMPFNPMMLSMGLGLGLPLGMSMPALAAMNLHPPLIPIMMPPHLDHLNAAAAAQSLLPPGIDSSFLSNHQKLLQNQTAPAQMQQQKRARTRINDEQLKILRAHFDINNSPTEEQIMEMADKSGLPPKVIKHWFRNTLFKERQRNKDSPYNFNNPPSTALNLEEYEKTGETKIIPIQSDHLGPKSEGMVENCRSSTPASTLDKELPYSMELHKQISPSSKQPASSQKKCSEMTADLEVAIVKKEEQEKSSALVTPGLEAATAAVAFPTSSSGSAFGSVSTVNSSVLTPTPSSSSTPSVTPTLSEPTTSQSSFLRPNPSFSPLGLGSTAAAAASAMTLPKSLPTTPTSSSPLNSSNPSKGDCSSSGKRANRTRFTDYQIKVLQEFFETNAYPKDDDLEYLSKLLNLSPRVIVVWFQNARQKARKVYENQPPIDPEDDGAGRFQRTPGLNYQCKKCLLVFQRYYELIKHQKSHCFKGEEDSQRLRSQLGSSTPGAADDTNSVSSINDSNQAAETSSDVSATKNTSTNQEGTFRCDKCSLVFPRFDLWREHQIIHIMNPNLFPTYPPDTPFGILQYEAQQAAATAAQDSSSPKRKLSEDGDDDRDDQPRDKRLRTTILPEQLDYLYQKYQIESNPSRKMLENIAREVGLKKRVVQVWFQNTRARERKGQFRAHQQVINKRCPFCPAHFKVKSALESHLATKHSEQYTKGEINIDGLPDEEPGNVSDGSGGGGGSLAESMKMMATGFDSIPFSSASSLLPNISNATEMQSTLKKYYEDSLKRYIDELTFSGQSLKSESAPTDLSVRNKAAGGNGGSGNGTGTDGKEKTGEREGSDTPLDLSKPVRLSLDYEKTGEGSLLDFSERSEDHLSFRFLNMDDARSETHSESTDNMDGDDASHESNPTSPASSTNSHHRHFSPGSGKRFRTQMTTLQLKVMKALFNDYKTPTMAECEMLGREIGLPKRVVQVWFQNARAKEKKNKLALAKAFGQEVDTNRAPEECKLCNFKYSHKYSIQDHIFTKKHIDNVKTYIINLKKFAENEPSGDHSDYVSTPSNSSATGQATTSTDQNNTTTTGNTTTGVERGGGGGGHTESQQAVTAAALAAGHSHLAHLHMMQMAAAGLPVPTSLASISLAPGLAHNLAKDMLPSTSSTSSTATTSVTSSAVDNIKQEPKEEKNKEQGGNAGKGGGGGGGGNGGPPTSTASGLTPSLLNPFGDLSGLMSGDTPGLLPYMYTAGIPGYYPGMPSSFFHPAMYAGRSQTPSKI